MKVKKHMSKSGIILGAERCEKDEMEIVILYTNIDDQIPKKVELQDYLEKKHQEIVFNRTQTSDIKTVNLGKGKHDIRSKNREFKERVSNDEKKGTKIN